MCYVNTLPRTSLNITHWWKQKISCTTNTNIKKGEGNWYPDALNGKCIIETHEIKNETNEEWRLRKRKLIEYYMPAIAAYHESIFFCFVKRIHPSLEQIILKSV